ncbi:MAG: hypothetical protein ACM3MF_04760 [Anaerolineae bacterium]
MAKRLIYISIIFAVVTVAAFTGWHALSGQGKVMGSHAVHPASASAAGSNVAAQPASAGGNQAGQALQQSAQSQAAMDAKSGRQPLAITR